MHLSARVPSLTAAPREATDEIACVNDVPVCLNLSRQASNLPKYIRGPRMAASMASLRKNSLVELSRLASSASGSDDAPLSCIEIVREGIGAESLSIVYGDVEEG